MTHSSGSSRKPVRVAIQVRTSAVDGEMQQLSQDTQVERCMRWCEGTHGADGYTLAVFSDDGFSGAVTWRPDDRGHYRPALRQVADSVNDGRVDVVMVSSLDRLSRSPELHKTFIEEVLVPHGVRLVEAAGGFEPQQRPCPTDVLSGKQ